MKYFLYGTGTEDLVSPNSAKPRFRREWTQTFDFCTPSACLPAAHYRAESPSFKKPDGCLHPRTIPRALSCLPHPVSPRPQVQASNPMEEDKVSISTVLRQAVSVEISLSNPLNEELRFLVSLQVKKHERHNSRGKNGPRLDALKKWEIDVSSNIRILGYFLGCTIVVVLERLRSKSAAGSGRKCRSKHIYVRATLPTSHVPGTKSHLSFLHLPSPAPALFPSPGGD